MINGYLAIDLWGFIVYRVVLAGILLILCEFLNLPHHDNTILLVLLLSDTG